ncbi:ribonucleotide reductase subunit alpha [Piscinibacter sp.]|jgi:hypothetical protein|uniref:ribonucleotide reductase subunit alpha n=1 Tax=Piscinibacter sp. TaxID=1903157 RepID=UPI0035595F89
MDITNFDDLLRAARQQSEPQRLLFVFAGAELPDDSTPEQCQRFEAGHGGALVPLACVDRTPQELTSFATLTDEAREFLDDWKLVFVAAMSGRGGRAPTSDEAQAPLQRMVEAIKAGTIRAYLPFDPTGHPVLLN